MLQHPAFRIASRLGLLALLLLALWNPPVPWGATPEDFILLLDDSLSVARASSDAAWHRVAGALGAQPAGSRLALVRFATRPRLEQPFGDIRSEPIQALLAQPTAPRHHALDGAATDIATALETGLRLASPTRATRLVLISDGRQTLGRATPLLEQARAARIPVYVLPTGQPTASGDAWIQSLQAPARMHLGQQLPVTVHLATYRAQRGELQLFLDGELQVTRVLQLEVAHPATLELPLDPLQAGAHTVSAQLIVERDSEARNNRASTIVNVEGASPTLYVSKRAQPAPLLDSLRRGGRTVRVVRPDHFAQALEQQPAAGVILLDDLSAADLPESQWKRLSRAVRRDGSGLIVLGGPRSFGAGAYRHSQLESLLPVTAQARDPQPPAAILFMVDRSGSMDAGATQASRLALARQALRETANSFLEGDQVGLLAFDVEPHLLLPLATHNDMREALDRAWPSLPTGGTRLRPALLEAVRILANAEAQQRLLLLVTDGFVANEMLQDIEGEIERSGIDVIAMAVGEDADRRVLARLAGINRGRLLHIGAISDLPRLMREEVERRRPMSESGNIHPEQIRPLPFAMRNTEWPPLGGYMVTRARPSASVYLRSENGDPLLAAHLAGAGRVVVLPAGLNGWARDWLDWPAFGSFAAGLLDWAGDQSSSTPLFLQVRQQPGELQLRVDLDPETSSTPDAEQPARLLLNDPNQQQQEIALSYRAPGRYEARVPVTLAGRYRASVQIGEYSLHHEFLYQDVREYLPPEPGTDRFSDWIEAGLLKPWPAQGLPAPETNAGPTAQLRNPLLGTALILFLLLLLLERRPDLLKADKWTGIRSDSQDAANDQKLAITAADTTHRETSRRVANG